MERIAYHPQSDKEFFTSALNVPWPLLICSFVGGGYCLFFLYYMVKYISKNIWLKLYHLLAMIAILLAMHYYTYAVVASTTVRTTMYVREFFMDLKNILLSLLVNLLIGHYIHIWRSYQATKSNRRVAHVSAVHSNTFTLLRSDLI